MAITLNTKVALRRDTLTNWNKHGSQVLKSGELAIVIDDLGNERLKIGNGISAFSELPYVYESQLKTDNLIAKDVNANSIAQGLNVKATPTSLATGVYTKADGNFNVVHGIEAIAKEGDDYAFVYNGENLPGLGTDFYESHGEGTFNVNTVGGLSGVYFGEKSLFEIISGFVYIQELSDYYRKSETSSSSELDNKFGNVYEKTETSSAFELSVRFENKIKVGKYEDDSYALSSQDLSVVKIASTDYYKLVAEEKQNDDVLYVLCSDNVDAHGQTLINVAEPVLSDDAATKNYVDSAVSSIDLSEYCRKSETSSSNELSVEFSNKADINDLSSKVTRLWSDDLSTSYINGDREFVIPGETYPATYFIPIDPLTRTVGCINVLNMMENRNPVIIKRQDKTAWRHVYISLVQRDNPSEEIDYINEIRISCDDGQYYVTTLGQTIQLDSVTDPDFGPVLSGSIEYMSQQVAFMFKEFQPSFNWYSDEIHATMKKYADSFGTELWSFRYQEILSKGCLNIACKDGNWVALLTQKPNPRSADEYITALTLTAVYDPSDPEWPTELQSPYGNFYRQKHEDIVISPRIEDKLVLSSELSNIDSSDPFKTISLIKPYSENNLFISIDISESRLFDTVFSIDSSVSSQFFSCYRDGIWNSELSGYGLSYNNNPFEIMFREILDSNGIATESDSKFYVRYNWYWVDSGSIRHMSDSYSSIVPTNTEVGANVRDVASKREFLDISQKVLPQSRSIGYDSEYGQYYEVSQNFYNNITSIVNNGDKFLLGKYNVNGNYRIGFTTQDSQNDISVDFYVDYGNGPERGDSLQINDNRFMPNTNYVIEIKHDSIVVDRVNGQDVVRYLKDNSNSVTLRIWEN